MSSKSRLYIALIFIAAGFPTWFWLLAGCVAASETSTTTQARAQKVVGVATDYTIQVMLDKGGATIDYDTLMQVYQVMIQSPHPIPQMNQLLRQLIHKRNTNPRIDQMILIFTAKSIGGSKFSIPNVQELIETILNQDDRINEWVISFVAEAISDYVYDLPHGDRLVDVMEIKLSQIRSIDRSQEEYFGYHFLPPPKSDFIRTYISGIGERQIRQRERNFYYVMIRNQFSEAEIESGMRFLQTHGAPKSGEKCLRLMACLLRYRHQLPFDDLK